MHAVTQEESDPTHLSADSQSSDHSAKDPSKHAIVSGSDERRLANRTPMGPNQQNKLLQLEPDSGVSNDPGTPDTCTKQICAQQQSPPGSFRFQVPVPPILKNGASVNYIPHNDHRLGTENGGSEGQDGDTDGQVPVIPKGNGKRSTTTTNNETSTSAGETEALVPTSGGRINSIAQQPTGMRKLDVVTEATQDQEEEHNKQATFSNLPMEEVSKQELDQDTDYFRSASNRMLNQLEGLKAQNKDLRRQLSEEQVAKEAIRQEKEILSNQFTQCQRSAKAKVEVANNELEKKEQQLAECKLMLSEMEKEKRKIESECEEKYKKLQADIDLLRKQIEDDRKNTELETLRRKVELYEKEKLLDEKENVIQKTIAELENKIHMHLFIYFFVVVVFFVFFPLSCS